MSLVNPVHEDVQYVSYPGDLSQGVGTAKLVFPFNVTITGVTLSLGEPANLDVIVDINKNGSSLFTTQGNRPKVAAGAFVGNIALPDTTTVAAGDYLTFDRDQVGGPASISYVGSATAIYSASSPRTLSRPSGSQIGDIHIAVIELYQEGGTGTSVTPPSGWTQIGSSQVSPNNAGGPEQVQYAYWFRDDGSAGPWQFAFAGASAGQGLLVTYHGCTTTGSPIDAYAAAQIAYATSWITPSVNTTASTDQIISILVLSGTPTVTSVPTGMVQRGSLTVADQTQSTIGGSGSKTWTGSSAMLGTGLTFALKADVTASQPGADLTLALRYNKV